MLAVIVSTLGSCTKDDTLKDADQSNTEAKGEFVIDPTMNYVINGVLTYDHNAIKNAAEKAVNIHFDQPKNKVVISTTTNAFEDYKKSNQELREGLARANYNKTNDEVENVQPSAARYIPAGAPSSVNSAFEDKSLIGYSYTGLSGGSLIMGKFVPTSDSDLTSTSAFRIIHNSDGTVNTNWGTVAFAFTAVFNSTSSFTNQRLMVNNESATNSLTKYYYANINFGGTSYFYTTGANNWQDMINLKNLNVKSYN